MRERRSPRSGPASVLLVSDDPGVTRLVDRGLEEVEPEPALHVVADGGDVLDVLHQRGDFSDATLPDVVLLDVDRSGAPGLELLETVKTDPSLRRIPVIALTSPDANAEVARAYELHANACVAKPIDPDALVEALRAVGQFWLSTVRLADVER